MTVRGFPGKCSTSDCTEQPWPQGVCLKWGCGSGATLALNLCPSCPASAVVGSSTYSPVPLGPAEPHHSPVLYLSCLTCVNGDNEMPVSEACSEGFVRKPVASLGQPGAQYQQSYQVLGLLLFSEKQLTLGQSGLVFRIVLPFNLPRSRVPGVSYDVWQGIPFFFFFKPVVWAL